MSGIETTKLRSLKEPGVIEADRGTQDLKTDQIGIAVASAKDVVGWYCGCMHITELGMAQKMSTNSCEMPCLVCFKFTSVEGDQPGKDTAWYVNDNDDLERPCTIVWWLGIVPLPAINCCCSRPYLKRLPGTNTYSEFKFKAHENGNEKEEEKEIEYLGAKLRFESNKMSIEEIAPFDSWLGFSRPIPLCGCLKCTKTAIKIC